MMMMMMTVMTIVFNAVLNYLVNCAFEMSVYYYYYYKSVCHSARHMQVHVP